MAVEKSEKKVILAVDDSPEVLTTIESILGDDYDVRAAKTAAAAMSFLREKNCSLILLDIKMPIFSGFDFMHVMNRDPDAKHIPVICITADTSEESEYKAACLGAACYITKPFTAELLAAKVRDVLQGKTVKK
jgi:DNA-binding response OmpR family regulator